MKARSTTAIPMSKSILILGIVGEKRTECAGLSREINFLSEKKLRL